MSSLLDKATSQKGDGGVNMPPPRRTPRRARFAAALAMLLGHAFAGGAGQAMAQDLRAQCEGEASTKGFSIQERWAWGQICAGKPANMADYPDDEDNQPNCNPASEERRTGGQPETKTLSATRTALTREGRTGQPPQTLALSSTFIEFIATHPRYAQVAVKRQARVECAIINGQIDLSNKKVRPELIIAGSALKDGINMTDARFLRSFSIERSSVTGAVNAAGATFDRNFTLKEGVYEDINLDNARIKTSLRLVNSTVTKTFTARTMDAGNGIGLKDMSFIEEVNLYGAKTAGELRITASKFRNVFRAERLDTGGGIFLRDASFEQGTFLSGAKTAGALDIIGSTFQGEFEAEGLDAGGGIFLWDASFKQYVSLYSAKTAGQLRIDDSKFQGVFVAEGLDAGGGIFLWDASFKQYVSLYSAKTAGQLRIDDSKFQNVFVAEGLDAGGGISLENAYFKEGISLNYAKTAGALRIANSTFRNTFSAEQLDAGGSIVLQNADFEKDVLLNGAKTAKDLFIDNSTFRNTFSAEQLDAGGSIVLQNADFEKDVLLNGAETAGALSIKHSTFRRVFTAGSLDAGIGISLQNASFEQGASLSGAKTAGALGIEHSTFRNTFAAVRLDVGGGISLRNAYFKEDVSLNHAKTAGALGIEHSTFRKVFKAEGLDAGGGISLIDTEFKGEVNLSLAKVNGMLQLASSSFADKLDLSHAHIANALVLYGEAKANGQKTEPDVPAWGKDAELILDHSYAGVLQARMPDSWLVHDDAERPSTLLARSLDGFVYDSLDLVEDSEEDGELGDEKIRSLIKWAGGATADHKEEETSSGYIVRKMCLASEWQQEGTPYKPQPYTQLAEKLDEIGATDQADRVLIARSHHYYKEQGRISKITGCIRCLITQYGTKPARPLYLFLGLVVAGAIINYFAYNLPSRRLRKRWTARLPFNYACRLFRSPLPALAPGISVLLNYACCLPRSLFYSFRNSIPLPGFLSFTKEVNKPERCVYLLYAQKIIALILLAFALGDLVI